MNAHHITDEPPAKAPAPLADIQRKLVSAQSCHPKAVQTLIAEALDLIDDVARAGIGAAPSPAVPSEWTDLLAEARSVAYDEEGYIMAPDLAGAVDAVEAMLTAAPTPLQEAVVPSNRWLTAAVDAAMVEMKNISPPMRRSECERLIRAALSAAPATPAQSESAWIERSMSGHHPTDGSTVEWVNTDGDSHITTADKLNWDGDGVVPVVRYRVLSAPAIQPAVPESADPFLVRDIAEMIGSSVPDVCKALVELGYPQRSTNMEIPRPEAVAVAQRLRPAVLEDVAGHADVVRQFLADPSHPAAQPTVQQSAGKPPSPTHGMNLGERIKHVGGRENAQGYIEFGSVAAVRALVLQWLRDMPAGAVGDAVQVNVRLLNALTALLKEVAGGGTPTLDTMIEARGAIKEAMQDHSGSTGGATL